MYKVAFDTVSATIDPGVTPSELGRVLRAYAEDLAEDVVKTIAAQDNLVGENKGQLEPHGVLGGMVFAMVARASYYSRLKWFESLEWEKMSCMLRGLLPAPAADKKGPLDGRRVFDKIVEPKAFDEQYGLLPAQPDDKSRVRGADPFAALPMFVAEFREEVAQQRGYRMPTASDHQEGTNSG